MRLEALREGHAVVADFLQAPVVLADVIETADYRTFRLAGRSADMVNIAGKRASLAGLTRLLVEIEGVQDGVVMSPESSGGAAVHRLAAVVVAPGISAEAIKKKLRQRIDPAFVPRRIVMVEKLPRNETGKLPMDKLWALVNQADRL
jgi:acyl-coenzyme A synthetase/AMP-(fatty) acid ligase